MSELVHDKEAGYVALELHAVAETETPTPIARVVFWDAVGDFYFEAFRDVPVAIVEKLIADAKATIKIR